MSNIQVINQQVEIVTKKEDFEKQLAIVEKMGRLCYASEGKVKPYDPEFIKRLIGLHHESVLRHANFSVILTTNRRVTHQLVRHQPGTAYSQQSQRYINFVKRNIPFTVIEPASDKERDILMSEEGVDYLRSCTVMYENAINRGGKPEDAAEWLPEMSATKIGITANIQAWRHFFEMRTAKSAQPQTRAIMNAVYDYFKKNWPFLVEDLEEPYRDDIKNVIVDIIE